MFRCYLLMGINQYFKVTEVQTTVSQANNSPSKDQDRHAKGLPVKADEIKYTRIVVLL